MRLEERGGTLELGPSEVIFTGIPKAAHAQRRADPVRTGRTTCMSAPAIRSAASSRRTSTPSAARSCASRRRARPAPGNPFGDNPVYSLGHRNVQGLAWDSAGRLWASEFGPDVDDELNLIVPGGNYGWPEVTGAPHRAGFLDAKVVWPSTAESSPSGLEIVGDTAYLGALRGQRLWAVPLERRIRRRSCGLFHTGVRADQERFTGSGRPPVGAQQQQKP